MKKIERIAEEYINQILADQRTMNYQVAYQDGIRKGIELAINECKDREEYEYDMPFFLGYTLDELEEEEASD